MFVDAFISLDFSAFSRLHLEAICVCVGLTFNIEICCMYTKNIAVMVHELDLLTLSRLLSGVLLCKQGTF